VLRLVQVFTVVGFNKYKGHPVSGKGVNDPVPETLAGHVGFWMSYDQMATPETFHWGYRYVRCVLLLQLFGACEWAGSSPSAYSNLWKEDLPS
jgi:hypothetical protein